MMFPVQDERIRLELLDVLNAYFRDNLQARVLDSSGAWKLLEPSSGEVPFRIQKDLHSRASMESDSPRPVKQDFIVRRKAPGEQDLN